MLREINVRIVPASTFQPAEVVRASYDLRAARASRRSCTTRV